MPSSGLPTTVITASCGAKTQINVTSHTRYRMAGRNGDDYLLLLRGIAYGVLDTATEARSTKGQSNFRIG